MTARYDLTPEEEIAQNALADELNAESADPGVIDCENDEHPEGAKRGGYVPVFHGEDGSRVFYDTTSCEWIPYDG